MLLFLHFKKLGALRLKLGWGNILVDRLPPEAPRVLGSVSCPGTLQHVARSWGGTGKRNTNPKVHRQLTIADCPTYLLHPCHFWV